MTPTAPRPLSKLVLENAVVDALFADPTIAAEFKGCLDLIANAPAAGGCSKCGRRRAASAYTQAKLCLVQMADAKKQRLKALLNAAQIEVAVHDGDGVKRYLF